MKETGKFEEEPLFVWLRSCLELDSIQSPRNHYNLEKLSYENLCNGFILNSVLTYIDHRPIGQEVGPTAQDPCGRLKNLSTFFRNLQSFYREVLNQLIVMPLPDLLAIARHTSPEESGVEMKKVLLLLLGCAVQSDKKAEFIAKIKELDLALQHAIMEQIQKITNDVDCVLNIQALELNAEDNVVSSVLHQLQRVVKERDTFAQNLVDLSQEHEISDSSSSVSSLCNGDVCTGKLPESQQHECRAKSPTQSERHHLSVELADCKAKLRRLRQELEEKAEVLAEFKEELQDKDSVLAKLRQENLELIKDARTVKAYRDELDVLRDKASKVERLESDLVRFREKLEELDFYKSRVDELREENNVLCETRNTLQDQIELINQRVEQSAQGELLLLQERKKVQSLLEELKEREEKLSAYIEANSRLEQDHRSAVERLKAVEENREMALMNVPNSVVSSLSDQLNESSNAKLLKLELENQKMKSELMDRSFSRHQHSSPIADRSDHPNNRGLSADIFAELDSLKEKLEELTIENERVKVKNERIQQQNVKNSGICLELQGQNEKLLKQNQEMEKSYRSVEESLKLDLDRSEKESRKLAEKLSSLQEKFEGIDPELTQRQLTELESKLTALKAENERVSRRNEDVTKENKTFCNEATKLKMELTNLQDQLLQLEKEKLETDNRAYSLEREMKVVEKDNSKLRLLLETADSQFEKARASLLDLERERQKFESDSRRLEEFTMKLGDSETEKKFYCQQFEIEMKKGLALKEDYANEKTKSQQLKSIVDTLCSSLGVVCGDDLIEVRGVEGRIEDRLRAIRSESAKDADSLRNKLSESERLNQDLNMRMSLLEEELARSSASSFSQSTVVSGETKTRLKGLEETNQSLLEENRNIKQQVYILQEQIRKLQALNTSLSSENGSLKKESSDLAQLQSLTTSLQAEKNKLEVDLRYAVMQAELFEDDNEELRKQLGRLESDHTSLGDSFEQIQRMHAELIADHESLSNIHQQLNQDYETLKREFSDNKQSQRQLRTEHNAVYDKLDEVTKQRDDILSMKEMLVKEKDQMQQDFKAFCLLQSDYGALKRLHDDLQLRHEVLKNDLENSRMDYRGLKSDFNNANLRIAQLQMHMSDVQEQFNQKDVELAKMENKCGMIAQLNATLKEENRTLMKQLDMLLTQNQELLHQALSEKEHYHIEEREFVEKLNNLKRQKEKLEEKIMDQYKSMEQPNKLIMKTKKSDNFVKRAAKALLPRTGSKRIKNPASPYGSESADNSSLHSDEGGFRGGYVADDPKNLSVEELDVLNECKGAVDIRNCRSPKTPSKHQRSSSSSTRADSSSSNGSTAVKPAIQTRSASLSVADRISLSGSERAIDVPGVPHVSVEETVKLRNGHSALLPPQCPPPRNSLSHKSPPPLPRKPDGSLRGPPPKYPGPHAAGQRTCPSPSKPEMPQSTGTPKKPPPPYPGIRISQTVPTPQKSDAPSTSGPKCSSSASSCSSNEPTPIALKRFRPADGSSNVKKDENHYSVAVCVVSPSAQNSLLPNGLHKNPIKKPESLPLAPLRQNNGNGLNDTLSSFINEEEFQTSTPKSERVGMPFTFESTVVDRSNSASTASRLPTRESSSSLYPSHPGDNSLASGQFRNSKSCGNFRSTSDSRSTANYQNIDDFSSSRSAIGSVTKFPSSENMTVPYRPRPPNRAEMGHLGPVDRSMVNSYYENLENLSQFVTPTVSEAEAKERNESDVDEETLMNLLNNSAELHESLGSDQQKKENSLWFEYGCV